MSFDGKLTKDRMKDTEVMMASNITRDLRFSELMFNFAARAETRMATEAKIPAPRRLSKASEFPEKRTCRREARLEARPSPPLTVAMIG